jgi:alkylated DNA repair dioxygenase AlkB
MERSRFDLFDDPAERPHAGRTNVPPGLIHAVDFLSAQEEAGLVAELAGLEFAPFEFHGFLGKRRVLSFGWRYGFDGSGLARAEPIPAFLLPLRERAARFAGVEPHALEHVLLTEYVAGAGIGWHRDRSVFGETIGISLLAPCRIRFRRRLDGRWQRSALVAEPRSIYLLRGAARREWEHSIPAVDRLRYSITFRTLA